MPQSPPVHAQEIFNLLPLAGELRERAEKVLARAETFEDAEAREMMLKVAASYERLADRLEIEFG